MTYIKYEESIVVSYLTIYYSNLDFICSSLRILKMSEKILNEFAVRLNKSRT
jgi:hypothetical protein